MLYPEDLAEGERLNEKLEEKHALVALRDQVAQAPGGIIRHNGAEIRRTELPRAIANLEGEITIVRAEIEAHDRLCRSARHEIEGGVMKRLSGLDASFLYLETPSSYMHVAGLMILDPATAPVQWSFDEVRDMYAARLHLAPPFRRRLVEVPFGVHHPVWIEDPDFDLDFHLHHIAVPQPGGVRQLATLAEEIVARPLDRRKPLWESWIIEGLEHGYIAVLTKTHHAAIDGVSGNEMTVAMLDVEPEGRDVGSDTWAPEHVPNEAELLAYAMRSLVTQPAKLVGSLTARARWR